MPLTKIFLIEFCNFFDSEVYFAFPFTLKVKKTGKKNNSQKFNINSDRICKEISTLLFRTTPEGILIATSIKWFGGMGN